MQIGKSPTLFPLISSRGTYQILKLRGAAIIRGDANYREALISKLGKGTILNVKTWTSFSFKIRIKHKFSLSINQI